MHTPAFAAAVAASLFASALLGGCTTTHVHGPTAADEIRAVERERLAAMVAADLSALDRMLAADLVYGHSTGVAHTKPELLAVLGSGTLDYVVLQPRTLEVRTRDDTALVSGIVDMEATSGPRRLHAALRFLSVYERRDARWQLVAYQSAVVATN